MSDLEPPGGGKSLPEAVVSGPKIPYLDRSEICPVEGFLGSFFLPLHLLIRDLTFKF